MSAAERVVLVGTGIPEARRAVALHALAAEVGAEVCFLQQAEPTLTSVLESTSPDVGTTLLLPVSLGRSSQRSWVGRVAGDHVRRHGSRVDVTAGEVRVLDAAAVTAAVSGPRRHVTGEEAPLTSPAWEDVPSFTHQVLVCRGPRCSARGSDQTAEAVDQALRDVGWGDDDVLVTQTGCLFPCNHAPVVAVHPDDAWFRGVDAAAARRIVIEYLLGGLPVRENRLPRRRRIRDLP